MQRKYRFDMDPNPRVDGDLNAFFNRQLEWIRPGLYKQEFPKLKGRTLVPIDNSVPTGAQQITTRTLEEYGMVQPTSNYSTEAPRVDFLTKEGSIYIRGMVVAYGFNVQELRSAEYAKMPLSDAKARIARETIERKLDDMMFNGWTEAGITLRGLLNVSGPTTYTVPVGSKGSKLWADKTPDEVLTDMHGMVTKVLTDTKEIESPNTMLLPLSLYGLISTRKVGDGSGAATIKDHFLANSEYVKRIESTIKSETAGADSDTRTVVYDNDETRLQFSIPQEFEQFAPQQRGMEIVTMCHARSAGLDVHRPKSVCYADGF